LLVFWNLLPRLYHRNTPEKQTWHGHYRMSSVILYDRVMFVFQVCFCDIDEEEGSRTLTILQKTFGNDRVMFVFQVCFSISQKQTWKTNMTRSLPNVFCNIVNVLEPSSPSTVSCLFFRSVFVI
jgi:hypothetical protein